MLAEVNSAELSFGSPSFTSHKKETSGHRERPAGAGERSERSERPERSDRGYERSERGERGGYERSDRGSGAFERRPSRGGGRGGFSRPSESREWIRQ